MILIPFDTDAPARHHAWVTVSIVAVNVILHFTVDADPYLLRYGEGLHPTQWVTSIFFHEDLIHLLSNMVFLWVFGLIVEGQTGPFRFLTIYLGIAIVQGGLEQSLFASEENSRGSLGASSVLYGLMVIAMLWAPLSKVRIFFWFWIRVNVFEARLRTIAICYVALDLLYASIWVSAGHGWAMSETLHLLGAAVGLPLGLLFLKAGWVESFEGDWLSLRTRKGRSTPIHRPTASTTDVDQIEERKRDSLESFAKPSMPDDPLSAWQIHVDTEAFCGSRPLDKVELRRLTVALTDAGETGRAAPHIRDYSRRYLSGDPTVRLLRARQCIDAPRRPSAALRILGTISPTSGSAEAREHAELLRAVEALKAQGVLEFDQDD